MDRIVSLAKPKIAKSFGYNKADESSKFKEFQRRPHHTDESLTAGRMIMSKRFMPALMRSQC
jgi:ADP-glucose pyrophosphorylase